MKNRYRVYYVGDDSCNHSAVVWASNHSEAEKMVETRRKDVDMVTGIKRLTNPFIIWGIVLVVLALVLVELVN